MALSSSLLLSGLHVACTSTSLGAISLPCLLPCSGLLSKQALIHSTWRHFAGAVLIWYTVSRLLQQTLVHKPLPFYGFVFVFLSYIFFSHRPLQEFSHRLKASQRPSPPENSVSASELCGKPRHITAPGSGQV